MSWGERSCKNVPCPLMKMGEGSQPKPSTCNVDCKHYIWDGHTKPDSVSRPKRSNAGQLTTHNTPIMQGLKPNRAQRRKTARLRNR